MGKIIRFRNPRQPSRWTKADAYASRRKRAWFAQRFARQPAKASGRWFAALMVILPLSAFTAVLLMPVSGGPEEAAASGARPSAADLALNSAASLDAAQPRIVAGARPGGVAAASGGDRESARFSLCSGPVRVTCVVDGDTIWYRGEKIRIADLDTPEVSNPGCANEAMMGRRATQRLVTLLNAGPFSLKPNPEGRSRDKYGRTLKLVTRGGASLGEVLVREGLAEQWGGVRRAWC
ncbi:thermonuclease family protein [Porphyrobacter sp. ULC335]|uniref:thermonuclease family protein n=1 Tax=Porphyrobacter sp. ULC335 TaxID=2854260 RepID=UPI00221F9B2F|nr:thermonuclease family protein [Porphyrobacter sp. ULC335]